MRKLDPKWWSLCRCSFGHEHRKCVTVSSSIRHNSHIGLGFTFILCKWWLSILCPVRIPRRILRQLRLRFRKNFVLLSSLQGIVVLDCQHEYMGQPSHVPCWRAMRCPFSSWITRNVHGYSNLSRFHWERHYLDDLVKITRNSRQNSLDSLTKCLNFH